MSSSLPSTRQRQRQRQRRPVCTFMTFAMTILWFRTSFGFYSFPQTQRWTFRRFRPHSGFLLPAEEASPGIRSTISSHSSSSSTSSFITTTTTTTKTTTNTTTPQILIHWKGEFEKNYSVPFRQLEFLNALAAVLQVTETPKLDFINALDCHPDLLFGQEQVQLYNEAMQYIIYNETQIPRQAMYKATQRCSLVHAMYQIVAMGKDHEELTNKALLDSGDSFADLQQQNGNTTSWCVRARNYGPDTLGRHSHKARSMSLEQKILVTLTPLLSTFTGPVNLSHPDAKIYVFDGLLGDSPTVLARRAAVGPITSSISPRTRICITNTPLPPMAAYTMCNLARIQNGQTILDPYAGSCTILLAAAMMAPHCRTVGIEIAHDVNASAMVADFVTRGLTPPTAFLRGDCTLTTMRHNARAAIGGNAFDVICTDPPYGVRESLGQDVNPLDQLFSSIQEDRSQGSRLVKVGGRVVAFVPVTTEETLEECLPSQQQTQLAGLELEVVQEQVLNDRLSRWLVAFRCIR